MWPDGQSQQTSQHVYAVRGLEPKLETAAFEQPLCFEYVSDERTAPVHKVKTSPLLKPKCHWLTCRFIISQASSDTTSRLYTHQYNLRAKSTRGTTRSVSTTAKAYASNRYDRSSGVATAARTTEPLFDIASSASSRKPCSRIVHYVALLRRVALQICRNIIVVSNF